MNVIQKIIWRLKYRKVMKEQKVIDDITAKLFQYSAELTRQYEEEMRSEK